MESRAFDCKASLPVQIYIDGTLPEGQWFYEKAADRIDELPDHLKPAVMSNKLMLSVELIFKIVLVEHMNSG